MADGFVIRRLELGDVAPFRALNAMFGKAFDDAEAYAGAPPSDDYLESLLRKDHIVPLVALADGAVIGGLVAYELDKFEQARREIYIYDLAVDEAHRRQGVATALIAHLGSIPSLAAARTLCTSISIRRSRRCATLISPAAPRCSPDWRSQLARR
jgi:ribosomal protein S18 acetylase RimI-like enzyme